MAGGAADYDLAIIGGGINGTAIARDAAGRGLRVLLVEQSDLASGTSSASSKLIHGGLRYLEHGAFRLVREALEEREVLLRNAPHLITPLRFVLPAYPGPRSMLMLRAGLFLYDHLGRRKILPATKTLDLSHHPAGHPLKRKYHWGFEYSDCWVDDSRLVVLNALDAAERGATIRTRTRCVRVERTDLWRLILNHRGHREVVTARVLVNAAGPWAGTVADTVVRVPLPARVRLVKGSHIVVRRTFDGDRAYILQNADRRIVFVLPFARDFTLIGTTDDDFVGDPGVVSATPADVDYLCKAASEYFRTPVNMDDVVWSYAGVRSLYDDGSNKPENVTRDYHLELDERFRAAPLLTIYGGKITTHRRLAEAALARIGHFFTMRPPWTSDTPLPGGDFPFDAVAEQVAAACATWPFLRDEQAQRLVRAYGTRLPRVLGTAASADDLGAWFGSDLCEAELRYLVATEWARTAEDVLWRRSKLGLSLGAQEHEALIAWFEANAAASAAE
jgi:glycerol-3-phosphate dehydrogenase